MSRNCSKSSSYYCLMSAVFLLLSNTCYGAAVRIQDKQKQETLEEFENRGQEHLGLTLLDRSARLLFSKHSVVLSFLLMLYCTV